MNARCRAPPRRGKRSAPWAWVLVLLTVLSAVWVLAPGPSAATGAHPVPVAPTAPTPAHGSPPAPSIHRPPGHPPGIGGAPRRASSDLSYNWLTGYWIYGPGDNSKIEGEGGAFFSDDRTNNLTVFGGLASGGLDNHTIENNETIYVWTEWYAQSVISPSARDNMSYISDPVRGQGVLFGGLTNLSTQSTADDTWSFDFATENWTNVTHGAAPPARENAAMAVDAPDGVALLEGGVDPSFRFGGSTGEALWNDTWLLNLTTMDWTRLNLTRAPAPMFGSEMIFDPVNGEFYLFGGCGSSCSSATWSYRVGDPAWTRLNVTGSYIAPRASAAFTWDPTQDLATLFGGFQPSVRGPLAYDDTDVFDPSTNRWTLLQITGYPIPPIPLYDLTVAEPEEPNCAGMFIWSGSDSLNGPPVNAWLLQSPNPPFPNCFIPELPNGSGPGGNTPPCPSSSTLLNLAVLDNTTNLGVAGASLQFDGPCSPGTVITGPNGTAEVYVPPAIGWNLSVERTGYYDRELHYAAPAAPSAQLTIRLVELPMVTVHCYGRSATLAFYRLPNVTVTLDHSVVLGTCDASGQLGPMQLPFAERYLTFSGTLPGYSGANVTVPTPSDAHAVANLTLAAAAPLRIHVVRNSDGAPVVGADGVLASPDPWSIAPILFRTGAGGWSNLTVGGANFTVNVTAPGFAQLHYGPAYHPWAQTTTWLLGLGPPAGSNLTVVLLDRSTGDPIAGGTVTVAPNATQTTDGNGEAKFTSLGPPGPAEVVGTATGYDSASRLVILAIGGTLPPVFLDLNRTPPCRVGVAAPCATEGNASVPPTFHLLPGSGWPLELLTASPFALLAAAVAGTLLRRAWPARVAPRPTPVADRPGPGSAA